MWGMGWIYMHSWVSSVKVGAVLIFFILVFTMMMQPNLTLVTDDTLDKENSTSAHLKLAPAGLQAKISWPLISHPAIILNGSILEVRIRGPSNVSLTEWNFTLYREYRSYSLTYDTPFWNSTTSEWHINVTIPVSAARDLYDLQVDLTDGLSTRELVEWNAVQVRYEYPANFTLFHITDTHLLNAYSRASAVLLSSLLQAAMADADLIILTGDLTESGTSQNVDHFMQIIRQSRVPVFIGPGNHDKDETGSTYGTYSSFFGPDYYTANFGPDVFVVMANSGAAGILNFTQIGWIERDMAASAAQLKILGFHHPLYYVREEGYDPYNFYLDDAEAIELIRICDTYDVDMVLTGHLHNDRVDRVNDTLWILTAPCGGGPWTGDTDPGYHKEGFRVIEIENYAPVKWNWTTSEEWSQPWDLVRGDRVPLFFHDVDVGALGSVINYHSEPLNDQIADVLVKPVGAGVYYRVTGEAPVVMTINGTDAWLIRLSLDLDVLETKTFRIYPSNAQAPILNDVEYPESVIPEEVYYIYANWTNPISGIPQAIIEISFDEGAYTSYEMARASDGRYRFALFLTSSASIRFRLSATDYSGQTTTSDVYSISAGETTSTPPPIDPLLVAAVASVIVIIIVVVVVGYWYRRRSPA